MPRRPRRIDPSRVKYAKAFFNGVLRSAISCADFVNLNDRWSIARGVAWTNLTKSSYTVVCDDGRMYHYKFLNLIGWSPQVRMNRGFDYL